MQTKTITTLVLLAVLLTPFAVVSETETVTAQTESSYTADEVIVKMKGADAPFTITVEEGQSVDSVIAALVARPEVEYAEPNYTAGATAIPNDMLKRYQWNFDNTVHGGIYAQSAWNKTNGSGVVVAVLDSGVAYENYGQYKQAPDLAGTKFTRGYDFVNDDAHPNDDNGHGTHIAGTIAQTSNNVIGTTGLAHGATIMPVKVLDHNTNGTYKDIAAGIRFAADNGADIINLSLAGDTHSNTLKDAVAYAYNKGVIIIAATGNDGRSRVSYPAAYNEYVIAVGAVRFDNQLAPYSNYGSPVDVVAPGGDLDVDQNGDGYGDGILQQTFNGSVDSFSYQFYEGTSMAAAHVSGAAALVYAEGIARNPNEMRGVLEGTADDLGPRGKDVRYGKGKVNLKNIFEGKVPANTGSNTNNGGASTSPAPVVKTKRNSTPQVTGFRSYHTVFAGTDFTYAVRATDRDGDSLSYSLTKAPSGMTISGNGVITWTPENVNAGRNYVTIEVTDGTASTKRTMSVMVSGTKTVSTTQTTQSTTATRNYTPQVTNFRSYHTTTAGSHFNYRVSATDRNNDTLTFALATAPTGMNIDANTGMITWNPTGDQVGRNYVTVFVTDGNEGSTKRTMSVMVR